MQVKRIQKNDYNTHFNGELRFYDCIKKKWTYQRTTPKEDKLLYDLFQKFRPEDLTKTSNRTYDKFVGKMLFEKISEFIYSLPDFKGLRKPTIFLPRKSYAIITEYDEPSITQQFGKSRSIHGLKIDLNKTFRMRHWCDKLKFPKKRSVK